MTQQDPFTLAGPRVPEFNFRTYTGSGQTFSIPRERQNFDIQRASLQTVPQMARLRVKQYGSPVFTAYGNLLAVGGYRQ